jgi:hypothetical protein
VLLPSASNVSRAKVEAGASSGIKNFLTIILFSTTVVLSSLDGSRLAVGAPMHDYSTAEANALSVNDNGGAIFLYEYDGSVWNQIWFLAGDAGEGLGVVGGWLEDRGSP